MSSIWTIKLTRRQEELTKATTPQRSINYFLNSIGNNSLEGKIDFYQGFPNSKQWSVSCFKKWFPVLVFLQELSSYWKLLVQDSLHVGLLSIHKKTSMYKHTPLCFSPCHNAIPLRVGTQGISVPKYFSFVCSLRETAKHFGANIA